MVSDHYQIPLKYYRTSVIVQNPNVPQPQTVQLDQETQKGFGNGAGPQLEPGPQLDPGSQLEPEKEKKPQHEPEPEGEPEGEFVDRTAFKEKLFARKYKHRGSHDILVAGNQYRERIMRLLDINQNPPNCISHSVCCQFYLS